MIAINLLESALPLPFHWRAVVKLPRRQFLLLAASAAALPAVSRVARAQTYPTRPVRLIASYPAGGSADIHARLLGQSLSERLGQPFIIENRPGANGNIGTESVVRAPPDGYTLLLIGTFNAVNATLYHNLNFNFIRDIAPVASIGGGPYLMVVNPSVPAKTVPQFIAYAKDNPGKINMASSGIGSASHVFGELFKMMAGVNLQHVPYRGGYVPDMLSGQVQVVFGTIASCIQHI
jgi:tripartite-type tricarboxylate transporter receptor subunit TctC